MRPKEKRFCVFILLVVINAFVMAEMNVDAIFALAGCFTFAVLGSIWISNG